MMKPEPHHTVATNPSPGSALAMLLLGGFRAMVDAATLELARRGHPDVRANHEFAMRAIQSGTGSAVELAEKLGISKQAAAKTVTALEARGYVARQADPADGRRKPLLLTPRGHDMLVQGQIILDDLRRAWIEKVGEERFAEVEGVLRIWTGGPAEVLVAASWLAAG